MDSFRVGGVMFNAGAGNDEGFTVATADGWLDGADVRRPEVMIPQGHGAYDLPGFLSPRVVSLAGQVTTSSAGKFLWFRSVLTGLLADGGTMRVVGDISGQVLYGDARLASKTHFASVVWGSLADYQIQFWFPNPRLFGNTLTFAGGVPSYHYGNFIAAPVHTVTGTMPTGYTITGPSGKTFIVTTPVVAGSPHVIDMGTGYLSINGVVIAGGVSDGSTWGVPAGGQVTQTLTPASGSGTLSTAVTDTYV